jgi:hypothetical protein
MHSRHLLSFVTDETGSMVTVHADIGGLDLLLGELQLLRAQLLAGECPHTHLFSEECGGDELSLGRLAEQAAEVNRVHHVKIYGWTDQWAARHGLLPGGDTL